MRARPPEGRAGGRRTQAERSRTTRAALIRAALECLQRSSYGSTTLTDVAAAAGVTKGALQHHFEDKQDLMLTVVGQSWRELVEGLRGISEIRGSLEDRVNAAIDHIWECYSVPASRVAFEIVLATRDQPEFRAEQDRLYLEVAETLDQEWSRLFADAPVDEDRVRGSRRQARATLQGLVVQAELSPAPSGDELQQDLALLKESILRLLTRGSD
ncbi:MAG: TetR/AcrR family transcriptional regulator [bacterium]|nr:TetR/AcrR family transcriptional regulator [bacterium]MCP5067650.1 TetR/AcrR family transcriptional regulator [bacterium]